MAEFGISGNIAGRISQDQLAQRLELGLAQGPSNAKGPEENSEMQSFAQTLKDALGEVNEAQKTADKMAKDFTAGKGENLHNLLIAVEKADIQLRTLVSVRNKTIEAYQEIMRMQV